MADISSVPATDAERSACLSLQPEGFYIRHPPAPHNLEGFITPDEKLFHTIHMGAAVVDSQSWLLVVDGLVRRPFALTLDQLRQLPRSSVTAFHECYGSPLQPPTTAVWRIGNVTWTGVRLAELLSLAGPSADAHYVWSEGLDSGTFAGVQADRYQKDLPLAKAMSAEVLVAYEMNHQPLSKERGGPVRLVVPGWFGTNMTKWLCKLSVQPTRAPGPYTTVFYNEKDPEDPDGRRMRPVWTVETNSIIVQPAPQSVVGTQEFVVEGWAWSHDGIVTVEVSVDEGTTWLDAHVVPRVDFSWQRFSLALRLEPGPYTLMARATSLSGVQQPLAGRRNNVHRVDIVVRSTS